MRIHRKRIRKIKQQRHDNSKLGKVTMWQNNLGAGGEWIFRERISCNFY